MPAHGRLIASPKYRQWCDDAATSILAQRRGFAVIPPPYVLRIDVRPPDRRRRDIDNLVKPVADALVRAGIIEDDSLVDVLSVWRDAPVKGGELRVTIQTK
jgi:crossover junction endodeoxyribonuclease RusA